MTASGGLYPTLGRYFSNLNELAAAGCMSRTRARDCLDGIKQFTEAEKKAISANIALKFSLRGKMTREDYKEVADAVKAWHGQFDEIYKKKG